MKTLKYFTLTLISLLTFGAVNAQINVDFNPVFLIDSCTEQGWQFNDSTQNIPAGATFLWSFGDGATSTQPSPFHVYSSINQAVYAPTLTYYMNGNAIGTHTDTINIIPSFNQVEFTYTAPTNCAYPQVYDFVGFEYNTNNPIVTWQWFLDGALEQTGGQTFPVSFMAPGTHQVTVKGYTQTGCNSTWSDFITVGSGGLTVSASYQTISEDCLGSIVDLYSTVSGGTAPYSFQWSWYDLGSSTLANPQQANVHTSIDSYVTLTVTDANGCTGTTGVTILNNSFITASAFSQPASACGTNCDGAINVVATGTNPPYTFEIDSVQYSGLQADFTNLCTGTYDVLVEDVTGCTQIITATVTADSLGMILDAIVSNGGTSCSSFDSCNSSVEMVVSNGVAPFQYAMNSGSFQTSATFDSLCPGLYIFTVLDAAGCLLDYTVFIDTVTTLSLQSYTMYNSCDSMGGTSNNSYITVQPIGGNAPFTYLWSDGSTANTVQNVLQGTYTVIVTDASGCSVSETFIVPVDECYTISGNVYVDVNGNCIFDSTDYPISCFVDLTATAAGSGTGRYDYTDANGHYEISAPAGTYFFDVNGNLVNNLTPLCPNVNYNVTLGANNQNVTVDFFLTPPPPIQDLSISTWTPYTFTPGFPTYTTVRYCNDGTISMSGSVVVEYDPSLVWYPSGTTPSGYIINNDVPSSHDALNHMLTYNFVGLLPGQCDYINIDYETPIGTGLLPGDPILIEASINPIPGDLTPANNTAYLVKQITSSWDPNDKAVSPEGDMTVEEKDHDYFIQFQNEGNGNAINVVVKDELDDNLNLRSLRNLAASHDYILTIENDNTLVFTFSNIQLPPKTVNEAASKGFISFTLTQEDALAIGTVVENTAAIYFDFNPAIITNTVENTIVEKVSGITSPEVQNALSVYPNPSTGIYQVTLSNHIEATSVKVYDLMGKTVLELTEIESHKAIINLEHQASGVYFLEVNTPSGKAVQKLIKEAN